MYTLLIATRRERVFCLVHCCGGMTCCAALFCALLPCAGLLLFKVCWYGAEIVFSLVMVRTYFIVYPLMYSVRYYWCCLYNTLVCCRLCSMCVSVVTEAGPLPILFIFCLHFAVLCCVFAFSPRLRRASMVPPLGGFVFCWSPSLAICLQW